MRKAFYETIDHTADIGIVVRGEDLPSLFNNAALAFFDILSGLENIDDKETVNIEVEASDLEELMVNWLGELLYLFDSDGWLFRDFQLELENTRIVATARGERFNPDKHEIRYYIKAVTYHMLELKQVNDHWIAKVIFDI